MSRLLAALSLSLLFSAPSFACGMYYSGGRDLSVMLAEIELPAVKVAGPANVAEVADLANQLMPPVGHRAPVAEPERVPAQVAALPQS